MGHRLFKDKVDSRQHKSTAAELKSCTTSRRCNQLKVVQSARGGTIRGRSHFVCVPLEPHTALRGPTVFCSRY
ncbi:hypothetical protein J6590_104163 [Homalodisca vitripennis]|nr:hypothetical protein J6590_104163 [Homalodisca vitripennis]